MKITTGTVDSYLKYELGNVNICDDNIVGLVDETKPGYYLDIRGQEGVLVEVLASDKSSSLPCKELKATVLAILSSNQLQEFFTRY